jgi:6-phosphofructokinase
MLRATIVSVSGENDKNLINFIASTVEAMRDQMATKADIAVLKEQMATKAELAAVKDDLARIESQMATKDELAAVKEQMATKIELAAVKEQMVTKIDLLETTMHGEFEQVHLRLDSIDRSLSTG